MDDWTRGWSRFRGVANDGQDLQGVHGRARHVEALGVRTDVRRDEEETAVIDECIEQRAVEGGETFEQIASLQRESEPEAFSSGPGEEDATRKSLGIGLVWTVKVADERDPTYGFESNGQNAAFEVKQLDLTVGKDTGKWQVAREQSAFDGADDHLFARTGHGRPTCCEVGSVYCFCRGIPGIAVYAATKHRHTSEACGTFGFCTTLKKRRK